MPDPTYLVLVLVLPFAGCLVAALLPANSRNIEAWIAGIVALAGLVLTLALYPAVTDGGVIRSEAEWVPAFGLDFTLRMRSEEHTSELQSLMRISYAVFCLIKKKNIEH